MSASISLSLNTRVWLRVMNRVVQFCISAIVFLLPLWFFPFTIDVIELPKQTLLLILTMIGLLAWLGQSLLRQSFSFTRSWVQLVLFVLLVGYLASSLTSVDRYLSVVGKLDQIPWAFATMLGFVLFSVLVVHNVQTLSRVYHLLLTFLASTILVGSIGLLQLVGLFPFARFFPASATSLFNTIGNANALATFLVLPVVVALSFLVLGCSDRACVLNAQGSKRVAAQLLVWSAFVVGLAVALVVDFWVVWIALLFGTAVMIGMRVVHTRSIGQPATLIVPALVVLLSITFLIFQTPLKFQVAGEVLPSPSHTWNIAKAVLAERPIFGSGPGTWNIDYSKFRALTANTSPYWANRFDHGISAAFSLPPMVGIVGSVLWLLLLFAILVMSVFRLLRERNHTMWQALLTLFVVWATVVFLGIFTNYTLSHLFVFWFFFAFLITLVSTGSFRIEKRTSPQLIRVFTVGSLTFSICAIAVIWLAGQRLIAETKYSAGIFASQNSASLESSINHLNTAVALNHLNDVYYRNLSQAYLVQLTRTLQSKDVEKGRQVDQLLRASIDTAKRATELSPANVENWATLALVYQTIAPYTRGADEVAITKYREALLREPNNPVYYTEIGKLFLLRADAYQTLVSSQDTTVRKNAESNVRAEFDKAAVELNQAIQVKPDYAPALYTLGILYERQSRITDAITKLEQVLQTNTRDIGVGFQLAILYYRNREMNRAIGMLEQILRLDPSYANARWYLSALYEEQGKLDEAIAQVAELKRVMPDNTNVLNRLSTLVQARDEKRRPKVQPLPEPLK